MKVVLGGDAPWGGREGDLLPLVRLGRVYVPKRHNPLPFAIIVNFAQIPFVFK